MLEAPRKLQPLLMAAGGGNCAVSVGWAVKGGTTMVIVPHDSADPGLLQALLMPMSSAII
jgi:hypothetical protein